MKEQYLGDGINVRYCDGDLYLFDNDLETRINLTPEMQKKLNEFHLEADDERATGAMKVFQDTIRSQIDAQARGQFTVSCVRLLRILPAMPTHPDDGAQALVVQLEETLVGIRDYFTVEHDHDDLEFRPTGEMDDVWGEWYAVYHKGKRVHEICANDADHARRIWESTKGDE